MRKPLTGAVAVAAFALVFAPGVRLMAEETSAEVEGRLIDPSGATIGEVNVREAGQGLIIKVHARGLPPGAHGMHLHQTADCSDLEKFESAGDHISQDGQEHGLMSEAGPHAGDLPNLIVGDDGVVTAEIETIRLPLEGAHGPLLDRDGGALVIHASEDDHLDPDGGGSGARIACAALERPSSSQGPAE